MAMKHAEDENFDYHGTEDVALERITEPEHRPDFVIVCDHGIAGGELEPVGRYRWDDMQGVWVPDGEAVERVRPDGEHELTYYGGAITVRSLTGDRMGWGHADKTDAERLREHHEIGCPKAAVGRTRRRCRSYRADGDDVQTVFAVIAVDRNFQAAAEVVTDSEITLTIDALRAAHEMCKRRYGMLKQHT